jgi:chemotaxis protein MotA
VNPSTLIGMVGGVALIATVLAFAALDPWAFVNLPGLAIVIGGTLAATFISYPLREVKRIFGLLYIIFRNERLYSSEDTNELIQISRLWMKGDIQAIEQAVARTRNPFLRTGVELTIAMTPEEDILDLMKWRISRLRAREHAEAQLFRAMASFAPAFGMIGTLVGLINMMLVLDVADLAVIGNQMAVALMTTFYGILLANLVFKPVAVKLERRTEQRIVTMNMVMQGISMMCAKRSPALMQATLDSFMAHYKDEIDDAGKNNRIDSGAMSARSAQRNPSRG